MSKYIINNCPCFEDEGTFYNCVNERTEGDCQDCTNCIMKQIVDLCKGSIRENERNIYRAGRMSLAINILDKLDIQEILDN